jgi:hypothetical protein
MNRLSLDRRAGRTTWLVITVLSAACSEETTQPNPASEPRGTVPELAVARNTWLTRADMWGIERWDFAIRPIQPGHLRG